MNALVNTFNPNDIYWKAVKNQDFKFDGIFLYTNRKRNKFCHPSCNSKERYDIEDFTWFRKPEEALNAGYSPCKRCKADDPNHISPAHRLVQIKKEIKDYIIQFKKRPNLDFLSHQVNVSKYHMHRTFKECGMTVMKYSQEVLAEVKTKKSNTSGGKCNMFKYIIINPGQMKSFSIVKRPILQTVLIRVRMLMPKKNSLTGNVLTVRSKRLLIYWTRPSKTCQTAP